MKKTAYVLLVIAFLLGITACNNNAGKDATKKGEKKVTIFTSMQPPKQGGTAEFSTNDNDYEVWSYVKQKLGIEVEFVTNPQSSYSERLQLLLVSGEYPDVVNFGSHTDASFKDAVKNKVVVPINDYLEKYPNLKKYTNQIALDALSINGDGNIYGFPISTLLRSDGYVFNKKWIDKLGIKFPEDGYLTLDEFTDILTKFTKSDPDGNVKNDTYGMAWSADPEKNFMPAITVPFGIMGWQKSNGKYKYMEPMYDLESDKYKKALEFNRNLFMQKIIDPNSPLNDATTAGNKFFKGTVGVSGAFPGHLFNRAKELKKFDPTAEVVYLRGIKANDGTVYKYTGMGTGYFGFWGVTNKNKNPDVIFTLFDWLLSDEGWDCVVYGREGINYKLENGIKSPIEGKALSFLKNFVRRNNGLDYYLPLTNKEATPYMETMKKELDISMKDVVVSQDKGYVPPIASSTKFIEAKNGLNTTISKIMIGELEVSAYDEALKKWYANGGEEYVKIMNDYIAKTEK